MKCLCAQRGAPLYISAKFWRFRGYLDRVVGYRAGDADYDIVVDAGGAARADGDALDDVLDYAAARDPGDGPPGAPWRRGAAPPSRARECRARAKNFFLRQSLPPRNIHVVAAAPPRPACAEDRH